MDEPTVVLAAAAGLASFLSPCMLPVIPAFFAQLAGSSLGREEIGRRDVFFGALLFVGGFSLVFAVLGVLLNAALREAAAETLAWLSRLAGGLIIALGLHLVGLLRIPFLDRTYAMKPSRSVTGGLGSFLFGASFAVAWTPCVGPILGGTIALAATQPGAAFPLLVAYAVGLGAPFLLVGLFPARGFAFVRRHRRWARRAHAAFGAALIGMGVLVFTGKLSLLANLEALMEVLS